MPINIETGTVLSEDLNRISPKSNTFSWRINETICNNLYLYVTNLHVDILYAWFNVAV